MKKLLLLIYSSILFTSVSLGYSDLRINDPQRWHIGRGTFEDATISIQPKGLYFEYNLFLTISARDLGLNHQDTVEIIYNFSLPTNAIVHDSWLWFDDEILKGKIMDRWTASQIYESIVNRRQDPSILIKNYDKAYELRIFPLAGDETRKVKLTFLLPTIWSASEVISAIPLYLLEPSLKPLKTLDIVTQLTSEWKNPAIVEMPEKPFVNNYIPMLGDYLTLTLDENEIYSHSTINYKVDAPYSNGIYLNTFENNNDNIYQIAYMPSIPDDIKKDKKAAILIDYELSKGNTLPDEVLENVKRMLHQNFTKSDSFNLIFSNTTINRLSNNWISADSNSIDSVFSGLESNIISNYSNLPSLLANGVEFITENGNEGQIILLANSDHVGESTIANALIDDLLAMMPNVIPIYIGDYIEKNFRWYHYRDINYKGNAYFYHNIVKQTGGSVHYINNGVPFNNMIANLFSSLEAIISSFDLHTSINNGFCYGRFDLSSVDKTMTANNPILQVGKYFGEIPFSLEFNGLIDGKPFSDKKEIINSNITHADSILDVIWAGKYIGSLEDDSYYYNNLSNKEVNEIIDLSIDKRVLTKYTAFLCLEPGMNIDILTDPLDGNPGDWLVDVDDGKLAEDSDTLFSSYPNPFNNQTTIKIRLRQQIDPSSATFKIYNILGQVVKSFDVSNLSNESKEFEFKWNGYNDNNEYVASGNYFFVMNFSGKVKTLKLVLVK